MQTQIVEALTSGLRPLRKPLPLRLSEWAARHFYLSAESSYEEQPWNAYPYQVAPLDCIGNDAIEEVVWVKSARVGYTKAILAAIAYYAEHKRRNQAIWQPTDEDSDEFVKGELEPMIRDVPAMGEVFPDFLHHHKSNTLRTKKFLGSMLYMRGGKAAKNYRRISVDCAYLDELDAFDLDVEGEGSAPELARKRIEGATFPKLVLGSTPKTTGLSMIEARHSLVAKAFLFHVHCPHCDVEHRLQFGGRDTAYGFRWVDNEPESVAYLCPQCAALYRQPDYLQGWDRGRWLADDGTWIDHDGIFRDVNNEPILTPRSVGFHIWTAYSPQTDWAAIVRQFLSATKRAKAGDKGELKTFRNTTLGESWEEQIEKIDLHELSRRAESYRTRMVPAGGLFLVAGIDTQDDRFEVVVWAMGRGEEMWAVDYTAIPANPADELDWVRLDDYLQSRFPHVDGGTLGIDGAAVDTGGHFTHQAYNFCRSKSAKRHIYAIKGDARPAQPIKSRSSLQDVNWRGKIIKSGVRLWMVGTDKAKDLFFGRLKLTKPGPGYVHFPTGMPLEFYDQLTAEARQLQKTARGEVYRYVKLRSRNEALDATVYAIFVSHALGRHTLTERQWDLFAERVSAALRAEAGATGAPDAEVVPPPRPRPFVAPARLKGSFVKGWK